MILESWIDFKAHLYQLEQELIASGRMDPERRILFVLYPKWRVLTVPINAQSFISRLSLLEAWRGLRDEQLQQLCGVSTPCFVHASGFTGGSGTLFDVAKLAALTIQQNDDSLGIKRQRLC